MTWRKLQEKLLSLTNEQLDTDVTVYDDMHDEFYPAIELKTNNLFIRSTSNERYYDQLDADHPYLEFNL